MNDPPWWRRTTVYQIYPRSFSDSNGDGIGDLAGIIGRLDYLRSLGVETLWLSPFFQGPQQDFGYDISDHLAVAPEYGTMDDCRRLIEEIHARGMKLVLDLVLNHTSSQHPWFLMSRGSRYDPLREFYLWRDGRGRDGRRTPNNWRSMLGGSGWHRDERTGQWYWATFLPFQPDLNHRNPAVKRAMLDVVRHWLRLGADGLRLDIFNALYKDAAFRDNPCSLRPLPSEDNPDGYFQRGAYTLDQPDTIAFARELRAVVDEFRPPRFLVGEVFGPAPLLRRYCGEQADGLHLVFLFKTLRTPFRAGAFRALIAEYEAAFPDPYLPPYVFGNHDRPRLSHRLHEDPERARLLATLQLTVRGVPFIYYGEELGLPQPDIPLREALDPVAKLYGFVPQWLAAALRRLGILLNRDECRAPMPWDEGPNAGFAPAHARPWLPMPPRAAALSVAAQERDRDSMLACYRRLLGLRRAHPALHSGALRLLSQGTEDVLAYRRTHGEAGRREIIDVFLNFSSAPALLDLPVPRAGVLFSTRPDAPVALSSHLVLRGHEGLVTVAVEGAPGPGPA